LGRGVFKAPDADRPGVMIRSLIVRDHVPTQLPFENRMLASLPREEYERILPKLEEVRLPQGKILYNAGDEIHYAYFLRGGMASLLSTTEDGRIIEVAMIGNEGVVGVPIVLRISKSPYLVMMQLPANALRIKEAALVEAFDESRRLQGLILRYTHTILTQITQSAACNRFHRVRERLCRWLLISRDRVHTNTIPLTQEFLSHMLGVPRTNVTMVARGLQEEGMIRYSRGKIEITDRAALEAASCECYRIVRNDIKLFLAA
jgi:CRP-like cAMP-binding protein